MKKLILLLLFIPQVIFAQNYVAKGDSCLKAKDYVCAGTSFDLYLKTDDSNGIAYMSAMAWSMAKDKEKALEAIRTYVRNNYSNGVVVFSKKLTKDKVFDFLKGDQRWKDIIAGVQAKEFDQVQRDKKKVDSILAIQHRVEEDQMLKKLNFDHDDAQAAYQKIKNYNAYPAIKEKISFLAIQHHR